MGVLCVQVPEPPQPLHLRIEPGALVSLHFPTLGHFLLHPGSTGFSKPLVDPGFLGSSGFRNSGPLGVVSRWCSHIFSLIYLDALFGKDTYFIVYSFKYF